MKKFLFVLSIILQIAIVVIFCIKIDKIERDSIAIKANIKELVLKESESVESIELINITSEEQEPEQLSIGSFKITGYDAKCEHCCGKSDGITASMTEAKAGVTCAMNRSDMKKLGLEYGDIIFIDGLGDRVIEDTGCAKGVIDVVCANHDECYKITGTCQVWRKDVT